MATTETFGDMLKRYMPNNLLVEEMKRRNYLWQNLSKDEGWMGGRYEVPFEGGEASSLSFGALTASDDIAETVDVLGYIDTQPELWGTMIFNEKDLDRHGSLEQSFLKILPGKLDQFISRMAERVSIALLNGYISKLSSDGLNGSIIVNNPARFTIGERIYLDDDDSAAVELYVTAINVGTSTLTVKDARASGSAVDCSAYTVAQNATVYLPGMQASGFTSLRSALLSSANGGSASLHNQTKATYPFLQAQQIDGSAFTAATIMDDIYDAFFDSMALGKGNPTTVLISFTHMKNAIKALEGNSRYTSKETKIGYGFRAIEVLGGDGGGMELVAIREMDNDAMFVLDMDALEFAGNNFFEKKRHANNEEFFLTRATAGYTYIVDVKFFGDLVVKYPSHCGVVHSISY